MSASIAQAALDRRPVARDPGVDRAARCRRSRRRALAAPRCVSARCRRVEVVAQRRAGQRLPAVGARQLEDPVAQPVELEPRAEAEVRRHHRLGARAGRARRPRRCRTPTAAPASPATRRGQLRAARRPPRSSVDARRRTRRGRRPRARRGAPPASIRAPGAKRAIVASMSIARGLRAHEPARRALDQPPALDQHRRAGCSASIAVVERLDRGPERAHLEHLAGDRVGAREDRRGRARSPRRAGTRTSCPARSTSWLATTVAMISRRRRWLAHLLGRSARAAARGK